MAYKARIKVRTCHSMVNLTIVSLKFQGSGQFMLFVLEKGEEKDVQPNSWYSQYFVFSVELQGRRVHLGTVKTWCFIVELFTCSLILVSHLVSLKHYQLNGDIACICISYHKSSEGGLRRAVRTHGLDDLFPRTAKPSAAQIVLSYQQAIQLEQADQISAGFQIAEVVCLVIQRPGH